MQRMAKRVEWDFALERLDQWQMLNKGRMPVKPWEWRQRNHSN